jgi:hypothetical protein
MSDAEDYKKLAEDCLEQAKISNSDLERKSLFDLATAWSRLAKETSAGSTVPRAKAIILR